MFGLICLMLAFLAFIWAGVAAKEKKHSSGRVAYRTGCMFSFLFLFNVVCHGFVWCNVDFGMKGTGMLFYSIMGVISLGVAGAILGLLFFIAKRISARYRD